MRVALSTLGCKANQYDTQAMRELFENAGYDIVDFNDIADIYVINTCTVTQTGDKKSRQMITRAHRRNSNAKIIVTGCYSQIAPNEVSALEGVSLVLGTADRSRIVELADNLYSGATDFDNIPAEDKFEEISATREGRTRAHLKIQEGCNCFCSYCIIPYARGRVRSRSIKSVREEMVKLNEAGFSEVVLTGIHLMSYGADFGDGTTLIDAIEQANGLNALRRIRLGSLDPYMLTGEFNKYLAANEKICRHFHLSLQSGSDSVLKRMNRRYTAREYAQRVKQLCEKMSNCAITTDIIVGFPGETEAEFAQTMEFVRTMAFSRIHVFPFSRRRGTKAYDLPLQVSGAIKRERTSRLIGLGKVLEHEYISQFIGTKMEVLFEEIGGADIIGHTDNYINVKARHEGSVKEGEFRYVLIEAAEDGCLRGTVIN